MFRVLLATVVVLVAVTAGLIGYTVGHDSHRNYQQTTYFGRSDPYFPK